MPESAIAPWREVITQELESATVGALVVADQHRAFVEQDDITATDDPRNESEVGLIACRKDQGGLDAEELRQTVLEQ